MVVSAREEGERTGEEEGEEEDDDDEDEDEEEGGGGVEPASASSLGLGAAAATAAEASSPNSIRAAAGRCSAVAAYHGYTGTPHTSQSYCTRVQSSSTN